MSSSQLCCLRLLLRRPFSPLPAVSIRITRCVSSRPGVSSTTTAKNRMRRASARPSDARKDVRRQGLFHPGNMKHFVKEIGKLGRARKVHDAVELLNEMKLRRVPPTAVVYNSLMCELGRQGDVKQTFKLYNRMKKHGLVPTDRTYTGLFTACSRTAPQGRKQLDNLLNEISMKEISLSLVTCNAAIQALSRHKCTPEALSMLDRMEEQYGVLPDVVSFTFALQACYQDKEDGASLAQVVWIDMESRGVRPDLCAYNEFIRACKSSPRVEHSDVDTERLLPPVVPFGGVGALVRHMNSNRVKPDIRTFHELCGLIDGDSKAEGELHAAMSACGIRPDVAFMNAVIHRKAESGDLDLAFSVFARMRDEGLQPDVVSFQALAHGCQNEEDITVLLKNATALRIDPIDPIFCTLLTAGSRRRDYKYLTLVMKLLDRYEVCPSETIVKILDAAAVEKPWEKKVKAKRRFHFLQDKNGFKGFLGIWKQRNGIQ